MKLVILCVGAMLLLASTAHAKCPSVTLADMQGVKQGAYPQQYELVEYEAAANCKMEFSANPDAEKLNSELRGNAALLPITERLPEEPLVVVPYDSIGKYGGTLRGLSNATRAGTSDFLSLRHANLVRYSDDLATIVPNVAKGWEWNDDYTQLTFFLRKGHRWSDGAPFTSADVKFWYDNLLLDPKVIEKPKDYALVAGKRMTVETPDETTVVFKLPSPKPGLLAHFATSYTLAFQPKHFLGKYHPDINPDADKLAKEAGFENGLAVVFAYYGSSDWTDTPSPMLSHPDKVAKLPAPTHPTLESHVYVSDTIDGRKLVANPYFHMVDTTGQQLPYISRQDERYVNDNEIRILKLINGEADYKSQSLTLPSAPLLLENQEKGDFTIQLKPTVASPTFTFNVTSDDPAKRAVFGDVRFRRAMSVAMNREEINQVAYFGEGKPLQYTGFSPLPDFVPEELQRAYTKHDPEMAKKLLDEVGMKDTDGDGFRELPNGAKITLNLRFTTQGIAGEVVELVAQHWSNVGIQATVKEVTPDEYRSAQSSNRLDVGMWLKGMPLASHIGTSNYWVPPFGGYFDLRTGMLWAEWKDSKGANGVEPPEWVKTMAEDVNKFQAASPGSEEQAMYGKKLADTLVDQMLFIGIVKAPAPIYHRNALKNFPEFKTWSYEYYRTYPYLPVQWYFDG